MLIKLENVSFTYLPHTPLAQTALREINLSISEGEFVGIIGASGSGKSTLIQHFNGLLFPTEGDVYIEGIRIEKKTNLRGIRSKIGVVFQFPEDQLFEETVFADIAFGPKNLGCPHEEIEERAKEAMELVGLEYEVFKGRSPFLLSGGEMRRVAMAGVLAMKPKAIVLDEPTSGLDAKGKLEILSYLKNLHRTKRSTVVLVSHDMDEVASLVDRLIVLDRGKIVFDDSPKKVFLQTGKLIGMGLGVPQISALMIALENRGFKVPLDVFEVQGAKQVILSEVKKVK